MTQQSDILDNLQIVAAVNDGAVLAHNLLRSTIIRKGKVDLKCYSGAASASEAYNQGLDDSAAQIVVFAHQDVFLPDNWGRQLDRAIAQIESTDPDWAIIGAFGVDLGGRPVGHAWSTGLACRLGGRFPNPVEATCIDEFVIVLNRASGLRFDSALPGFHLYGTDIVLSAAAIGLKSYVADIPAIHNSKPVRGYRGGYSDAWHYMRWKWSEQLPVPTLTVPLTRSPFPLMWAKLRLWKSLGKRLQRAGDSSADPRELATQLEC
ncbi:hypothetical protein ABIE62_000933 [Porphyrobacter sp. MBR-155]|uniref:hypothetical protein n=1 Tax=Porphyrobacter sp. MBR-155 TaxID=3156464 RepID=UPI003396DB82